MFTLMLTLVSRISWRLSRIPMARYCPGVGFGDVHISPNGRLVVHKDPDGVGVGILHYPLLGIGCSLKDSE